MHDSLIPAKTGLLALATTFYLGHLLLHTVTDEKVLAYKATEMCMAIRAKGDDTHEAALTSCLSHLEEIVWHLVTNNKINLGNCKPDLKGLPEAMCSTWVSWWLREILVTNPRLVNYIKLPLLEKNRTLIPREEDEPVPTTTTTTPAPRPSPRPKPRSKTKQSMKYLKNKLNEVGERLSAWRESTEAVMRERVGSSQVLSDDEGGAKENDDVSLVQNGGNNANTMVGNVQNRAKDIYGSVRQTAMTQAERASRLAADLKVGVGDMAKYAVDSVKDMRTNLVNKWQGYKRKA